ncbi:ribonuclease H-like [Grus japonensis]|uniref:Ribonuclease H-like n=1 Tax=Grus japonensis TaxID=30415 RepID=A0ABC9VXY6_GRUJA
MVKKINEARHKNYAKLKTGKTGIGYICNLETIVQVGHGHEKLMIEENHRLSEKFFYILDPYSLLNSLQINRFIVNSIHFELNYHKNWSICPLCKRAQIGNPNHPGILEVITDWPEGKDFGISTEEEVMHAEEATLYNKLTEDEKQYAQFTDGSCRIVGKHRRWKAAVWSSTRRVAETAEGQGESRQFAEVKAIQLALHIAE